MVHRDCCRLYPKILIEVWEYSLFADDSMRTYSNVVCVVDLRETHCFVRRIQSKGGVNIDERLSYVFLLLYSMLRERFELMVLTISLQLTFSSILLLRQVMKTKQKSIERISSDE